MRTVRIAPIVLALALLLVAGCGSSAPKDPHATYAPVPDAQLFKQIRKLPGVVSADVSYKSDFNGTGYYGNVSVRHGIDQLSTLDRVFAILWKGRPGVLPFSLEVDEPGKPLVNSLDLDLNSYADWVHRYGPQPGDGQPPD
jgi:hypothetical protein